MTAQLTRTGATEAVRVCGLAARIHTFSVEGRLSGCLICVMEDE